MKLTRKVVDATSQILLLSVPLNGVFPSFFFLIEKRSIMLVLSLSGSHVLYIGPTTSLTAKFIFKLTVLLQYFQFSILSKINGI